MSKDTITIDVECKRLTDAEAVTAAREGKAVWTWCSNGRDNWIEMRFAHADAIAYLFPYDPINLPEDIEEWLPEEPCVKADRILLVHQLRTAYTNVWGYADGMNDPTLADLCENREQAGCAGLLMDMGMTWAQIAEAIGCPPGKEMKRVD